MCRNDPITFVNHYIIMYMLMVVTPRFVVHILLSNQISIISTQNSYRKPKGQSRIDSPESQQNKAHDTERR